MKLFVNEPGKLKDHLDSLGYLFPCNGEGKCGRCRIHAPSLIPTPLDARFLSESDIANGIRLACDKVILTPTEIDCNLKLKPTIVSVENPSVYAIYGRNSTEFGLTDDGIIVESIVLEESPQTTRDITALFNTHVIELYETHNIAKAETILLLGVPEKIQSLVQVEIPLEACTYIEASEAHLPGIDILIPPIPSKLIGNDDFIELLYLPDDSLLISGSNFLYKGKDIVVASLGKDITSSYGKKAFLATINYFEHEFCPSNVFSFEHIESTKEVKIEKIDRRVKYIASDILSSHKRIAELNRLARKIVRPSLADEDVWQDFFSKL